MNTDVPATPAAPSAPDPRLDQEEKASLSLVLLDLDEAERHRCIILARRYERFVRTSPSYGPDLLPGMWLAAHDRAIAEIAAARGAARMNGKADWDDLTYREPKK